MDPCRSPRPGIIPARPVHFAEARSSGGMTARLHSNTHSSGGGGGGGAARFQGSPGARGLHSSSTRKFVSGYIQAEELWDPNENGGGRRNEGGPASPLSQMFNEFAEYLGVDPEMEAHMMGIVAEAWSAPLPEGWSEETTSTGMVYYYNTYTDDSQWAHPLDSKYRAVIAHEKDKGKTKEHKHHHGGPFKNFAKGVKHLFSPRWSGRVEMIEPSRTWLHKHVPSNIIAYAEDRPGTGLSPLHNH